MTATPVIFITGASSGIGYATALLFAQQGYNVAGTARDAQRLDALHTEIERLPQPHGALLALAADVRQPDELSQALDTAYRHFGRIDVLIANAGIGHRGAVVASEWQDVELLLRTNIDGVLHTVRAGVPLLQQGGGGHIVFVSSVVYNMTVPYAAYYAASKAFVSSIARSLRMELLSDSIHVTDMIVGRTATAFNANRLGGKRSADSVPSMTADHVAQGIYDAVQKRRKTAFLRLFDRLTVWGNIFFGERIGRVALKQYK